MAQNHLSSARHPRPLVPHYSDNNDNNSPPGYQHHHSHDDNAQLQQHHDCQASWSRLRPGSRQTEIQPPEYAPINPYKYATGVESYTGVAEIMLSEQLQGTSHSFNITPPRSCS
ncbi:hypothetical protein PGTUg99_004482 [Puccinia graminis f. sp. tritici]|uniref:Uncharacterized protein n=1 Tax=Puccinia graminis f. sp. tritici TaxID=56615 RepID=A0A5B0LYU1_PUCGR|nr:hypothetical protein PGTUg99_004482 [Puccinia graminis f. sp. tritici]